VTRPTSVITGVSAMPLHSPVANRTRGASPRRHPGDRGRFGAVPRTYRNRTVTGRFAVSQSIWLISADRFAWSPNRWLGTDNPLVAGLSLARSTLNLLPAGGGDRVGKPVRSQPVGDRCQASHTQSPPRRAWLQTTPSWPTFNKLRSSESWVQDPPCAVILFGNAVKHIATLIEKLLRSRRNLSRS
jgi:hypothetical protein